MFRVLALVRVLALPNCSDKGLGHKMSAFKLFTVANYPVILSHRRSTRVSFKLYPLYSLIRDKHLILSKNKRLPLSHLVAIYKICLTTWIFWKDLICGTGTKMTIAFLPPTSTSCKIIQDCK